MRTGSRATPRLLRDYLAEHAENAELRRINDGLHCPLRHLVSPFSPALCDLRAFCETFF
jgi:hypothetical protein